MTETRRRALLETEWQPAGPTDKQLGDRPHTCMIIKTLTISFRLTTTAL